VGSLTQIMASASRRIRDVLKPVPRPESWYLKAELFTREAYQLDPGNGRVFRQLAAILLGRERWHELADLAEEYAKRVPNDPIGWMSLGLGMQRQRRIREARDAFDAGMAKYSTDERARLDRIERVLGDADSSLYAALDSAGRADFVRSWWKLTSPVWSQPEGDARTEFFARLAYAELRWSMEEYGSLGADTPFGRHYVRYGPANQQLGQFLLYDNGLIFSTCMRLARCNGRDAVLGEEVRSRWPSLWDNSGHFAITEMPVSISRFRGAVDSVDLLLAARVPASRDNGGIRAAATGRLWVYSLSSPAGFERTVETSELGYMTWRERVASGDYYARMESSVDGTRFVNRAVATIRVNSDSGADGFATRGFGLSDVVIGRNATVPPRMTGWRDATVLPLLGTATPGATISVLWETYELGTSEGASRYRITIAIQRGRSAFGRIAARIVGGFTGRVIESSTSNELSLSFDREVVASDVQAELLSIALGTIPVGSYIVRVTVQDSVTGRSASRVSPLVIAK
jgi:GWxTD domain-containing protein